MNNTSNSVEELAYDDRLEPRAETADCISETGSNFDDSTGRRAALGGTAAASFCSAAETSAQMADARTTPAWPRRMVGSVPGIDVNPTTAPSSTNTGPPAEEGGKTRSLSMTSGLS